MELQIDGLYSLLQARHIEVLHAIQKPGHRVDLPRLNTISEHMSKAMDSIQVCSEEFEILRKAEPDMTGMPIVYDGPMGESFNPLQD